MSDLQDAIANAVSLLPTGVKSDLGVHFLLEGGGLRISGTDGYTFVTQLVDIDPGAPKIDHFLDKATVKALPKELNMSTLVAEIAESGVPRTESNMIQLIDMATSPFAEAFMSEIRFAPDRVKKIGSLKPAGLPIVCRLLSLGAVPCVQFDYGDAKGIFTLLEGPE